jgi:DNA end-binding protein Ku
VAGYSDGDTDRRWVTVARPVWRGAISFGLVNVGVSMYTATEARRVSFREFDQKTAKRVRHKRVAEGTDREVDYEDVAKGYETSSGEHILVTQEELESVAPETTRRIAIDDFVELAEIDPIYYERTYYLAPSDEESEHAYALLREAMKQAGLAGIATFVMRNKEHLAALRVADEIMVLTTMYFADEVRDPQDTVDRLPEEPDLPQRELDTAVSLIRELTTSWEPDRYHDTYRERVLSLVEQKAKGEDVEVGDVEPPEGKVVDLMSALQESIERARKGASSRSADADADLENLSKKELYERAGQLGVEGRSKMSKDQLVDALAKAS